LLLLLLNLLLLYQRIPSPERHSVRPCRSTHWSVRLMGWGVVLLAPNVFHSH